MTATIHAIPTQAHALSLARQVIRSPDDHSAQILHDACDVLANGDWLDKQQSRMLRKTLPKRKAEAAELVTDVTEPNDATPGDMSGWAWMFWGSAALWLAVTLAVIRWLA